jgi:hypothetical protein
MLFLQQPAPQIEARMGAAGDCPLRRSVGGLDVRQFLQPLENQSTQLCANNQLQIREICGRE